MLQFVAIEHVLNFITITDLINNQLQYVYKNQFVFLPEVEKSTKGSVTRKLRRGYRIMFSAVNNDHIEMSCSSLRDKRQIINEEHLSSLEFVPSGNTKYLQFI